MKDCCCSNDQQLKILVSYDKSPYQNKTAYTDAIQQTLSQQDLKTHLLKFNPSLTRYFSKQYTQYKPLPKSSKFQFQSATCCQSTKNKQRQQTNDQKKEIKKDKDKPEQTIKPPQKNIDHQQDKSDKEKKEKNQQKKNKEQEEFKFRVPKQKSKTEKKIQDYVNKKKGDTRQFPNTKFRKFYNKQALETYGAVNTHVSNGGVVYGQYMKTHSVNPHTRGNNPKQYETYKGSLNHAKRYIKDKEKEQKEMLLQIARKQPQLQKKYIDNQKNEYYDRHNQTHRTPITKISVKFEDKNIDKKQIDNYKLKITRNYPNYYLTPNVQSIAKIQRKPKQSNFNLNQQKIPVKQNHRLHSQQRQQEEIYQTDNRMKIIELRHMQTQTNNIPNGSSAPIDLNRVQKFQVRNEKISSNPNKGILKQKNQTKILNKHNNNTVVIPQEVKNKQSRREQVLQGNNSTRYIKQINIENQCDCKDKQCLCLKKMKTQILQKAQNDPQLAHRLISYAKKSNMYKNYNFEIDTLNNYPCHKIQFDKKYGMPLYQMNPRNYKCHSSECLKGIPYAGKGMLNGRYQYEPYNP